MDNRESLHYGYQPINTEGILIGHEKGREAEKIEVTRNLLKAGVSIDIITQTTGLSVDYIEKIQEKKF